MSKSTETLIDDTRAVSFTFVERLYLQRAIDILVKQLQSSTKKETAAEIIIFREKEIEQLTSIRKRLGA